MNASSMPEPLTPIQQIQVRMTEQTIQQVDNLQSKVHAPSRSDAVRRAIDISNIIVNAIERGSKIIIENKNGRKQQMFVTGLDAS